MEKFHLLVGQCGLFLESLYCVLLVCQGASCKSCLFMHLCLPWIPLPLPIAPSACLVSLRSIATLPDLSSNLSDKMTPRIYNCAYPVVPVHHKEAQPLSLLLFLQVHNWETGTSMVHDGTIYAEWIVEFLDVRISACCFSDDFFFFLKHLLISGVYPNLYSTGTKLPQDGRHNNISSPIFFNFEFLWPSG